MSLIADQATDRENYNLKDIFNEIVLKTQHRELKEIKDEIELNRYRNFQ